MPNDKTPSRPPATAQHDGRKRGIVDGIALWLFIIVLLLCPLPDGSVGPMWVTVWVTVSCAVVLLVSYRDLPRGAVWVFGGLFAVLAGYGLVAYLQSVSPGPLPLPIWVETAAMLGNQIAPLSGSIRDAPLFFLGRPLLAALVLTAAIALGADRRHASRISWALIITACLYGTIGAIALVFSLTALRPFDQEGSLTAFFISRNTTATYLGTALLVTVSLIVVPVRARLREGVPLNGIFSDPANRRLLILTGAALFLLILLPLTKSRAGLMLTLLLVLGTVAQSLRGAVRSRMVAALAVLGVFALVYGLSGEGWRTRQATVGLDTLGRLDAYRAQLAGIAEHPVLGLGLGSFAETFQRYRPPELGISGIFDIGHSTPLELAFEGGLPLAGLVGAFVIGCGVVLVRGLKRRPRDPYILSGLLVGLLGLAHSSFDFSLQIPGYLIVYLAVVGIGLSRALMPEETVVVRRRVRADSDATRATAPLAAFRGTGAGTPPAPPPD
ncbi:O-antigen ligase family protein [Xanthobacter aminoxidans]|uniref:O-antigen ligase family protein n=1 Tax=Xanthobacter aminoxidans TaxID=186280 RepID=UPI003726D8DF